MRYPFRMKFQDTTMCEAQQNIRVIHKRNKEKRNKYLYISFNLL